MVCSSPSGLEVTAWSSACPREILDLHSDWDCQKIPKQVQTLWSSCFQEMAESKSSPFPRTILFFFLKKKFRNSLWLKGNTPTNCALSVFSSYIYIFFQLWDIWMENLLILTWAPKEKTQGGRFLSATIPWRNHLWQDSLEAPMVATDFVPYKLGSEIWVGHSAQNPQPVPWIAGLSCSLSFTRAPLVRSFSFKESSSAVNSVTPGSEACREKQLTGC